MDAQPSCEEEGELRNMILAMVDEPLAILIKLADRLHNMRTVTAYTNTTSALRASLNSCCNNSSRPASAGAAAAEADRLSCCSLTPSANCLGPLLLNCHALLVCRCMH